MYERACFEFPWVTDTTHVRSSFFQDVGFKMQHINECNMQHCTKFLISQENNNILGTMTNAFPFTTVSVSDVISGKKHTNWFSRQQIC